jgi:ABC-type lipoprotein release transport system permease subunit
VNAGETTLAGLREPVRRELQAAAPGVPVFKVRTFREHKDASLVPWLFQRISTVAATFGTIAVFLAIIGLYGAKAYSVSRRTREIGIRLALGLFLGSVIVDLDGFDPVVFGVAALALFVTTLAASWLPARRAMKVQPMVALRSE